MELNPDFKEFFESLSKNEVRYLSKDGANVDGLNVHIIDLEHLKQNKRAVGRFQDLADLESLG
jgi:hypothetical protein